MNEEGIDPDTVEELRAKNIRLLLYTHPGRNATLRALGFDGVLREIAWGTGRPSITWGPFVIQLQPNSFSTQNSGLLPSEHGSRKNQKTLNENTDRGIRPNEEKWSGR